MTDSRTIAIAGAGPAGLTAAINLARAGYEVVVHEQHEDVGMRFSEDFQALENWTSHEDVLETIQRVGFEPNFYYRPIHEVSSYGPRSTARVSFVQPMGYLVHRGRMAGSLDVSLKRQALDSGVQLRFSSHLKETQADIVATGPRRALAVAIGIIFDTDSQQRAAVLLDNAVAPKGYAYALTADKRGTLAVVLYERFSGGKAYLEAAVVRFKELLGLTISDARHFAGYGDFALPRSATVGQRRYAGEAAGFQDYLFGFGIRHAMVSGYLASKSIIERVDYDTLWSQSLKSQLRASMLNRYWYEILGNKGYTVLVRASGLAREPKQFWTKVYTRPLLRMIAYPLALRSVRLPRTANRDPDPLA